MITQLTMRYDSWYRFHNMIFLTKWDSEQIMNEKVSFWEVMA